MTRGVAIWSILLQLEPQVRSEAFPWGRVAWILGWGAVAVWPRAAVSVFRVRLGLMLVSLGAAFALTLWAGGGLGGPARLSLSWMPFLVAMFGTWKQTAWATATLGLATAAGAMASAWPDPVGQDLVLAASRMLDAGATGLVGVGMMAAFRGAVSGASASSVQHPSSAASAALPTDVTSVPMLPLGVVGDVAGTPTLTAIEREVVDGLAVGLTPQQIALREGWDVRRVYDAVAHAKSTFGAQTIEHLVVLVTAITSTVSGHGFAVGAPAISGGAARLLPERTSGDVGVGGRGGVEDLGWAGVASKLSSRQLEVVCLIGGGAAIAEAADMLGISSKQVSRHLAAARRRTGCATNPQLLAWCAAHGLFGSDADALPTR